MFCPLCKAEYRGGFTRCADCDVDLVSSREGQAAAPASDPGFAVIVWKGNDAALMGLIANTLGEAGIDSYQRACQLQNVLPPIAAELYELRVYPADLVRALEVLADLVERCLSPDAELPPQVGDIRLERSAPKTNSQVSEGLTCGIWSGQDQAFARFVTDALRENSVVFHAERNEVGNYDVLVHPEEQAHAREILADILEGVPPREVS